MLTEFSTLSPEDQTLLLKAPAMITILVGGADDDLSTEELNKAQKTVKVRSYNEDYPLQSYYQQVAPMYDEQLKELGHSLPSSPEERTQILAERLEGINAVLAQMDAVLAYNFYKDLTSFATAVARADGGFLRWITIGPKEAKVVDLPMINAIAEPEEE